MIRLRRVLSESLRIGPYDHTQLIPTGSGIQPLSSRLQAYQAARFKFQGQNRAKAGIFPGKNRAK
jgi:hypothetical protein